MNTLETLFPSRPAYEASWQAIYIEPIVGSGEHIAVAVAAYSNDKEYRVIQAIRSELLDCLYGSQASSMQSMIDWLIESSRKEVELNGSLDKWVPPFGGVKLGASRLAADENIEGILRQAVRFSASLSTLALDAEREDDEEQPRRYAEHWTRSIVEEVRLLDPHLISGFRRQIQVSEANVMTSYGFLNERYVSNFGLLVPTRLSASLNSIKAKLFDLETLKKSNLLVKPESYEVIVGTPSFDDPTLSNKAVERLRQTIEMVEELAQAEDVEFFRAESAKEAAEHLKLKAA